MVFFIFFILNIKYIRFCIVFGNFELEFFLFSFLIVLLFFCKSIIRSVIIKKRELNLN